MHPEFLITPDEYLCQYNEGLLANSRIGVLITNRDKVTVLDSPDLNSIKCINAVKGIA